MDNRVLDASSRETIGHMLAQLWRTKAQRQNPKARLYANVYPGRANAPGLDEGVDQPISIAPMLLDGGVEILNLLNPYRSQYIIHVHLVAGFRCIAPPP